MDQIIVKLLSIQAAQQVGQRVLTFGAKDQHLNWTVSKDASGSFDMDTEYAISFTPETSDTTVKLRAIQAAQQAGRRVLSFSGKDRQMNVQVSKTDADTFDMDLGYAIAFTPIQKASTGGGVG